MPVFFPGFQPAQIEGTESGTFRTIDASDFEEAAEVIFELADFLDDTTKPMLAARSIARDDMIEHFDTETAPDGSKWEELTDVYAKRRGAEHPILDDRGTNIRSPSRHSPPGTLRKKATANETWTVTGDSIFFDTTRLPEYWKAHQFGKEGIHVALTGVEGFETFGYPARPFIGLSEDAEFKIVGVFDLWFAEGVEEAERNYKIGSSGTLHHRGPRGQFGPKVVFG